MKLFESANTASSFKQLETIDTTIKNTQSAYEKIVETSQVLLTVIKKKKRLMKFAKKSKK